MPPGSRGGRPSSPRRAAPSLSVSSPPARGLASSSAKPGTAGELLRVAGCSRHTPAHPGKPTSRPRGQPGRRPSHLRGKTTDTAAPPPCSALSEPSPDKPPRIHYKARKLGRPAPNKEQRRGRALATEPPLPTAGPRPHTRAPPPRHFRFQKRSSFKLIFARPVGRRPPSQAPILRPPLHRVTNKFREPVQQPPLEPVGLRTGISGSLRAPRSLPDGHHVCPLRFPPPPPHAHKEWAT